MKLDSVTAAESVAQASLTDSECVATLEKLLEKRVSKNGVNPRLIEQRNEHAALRRAIEVLQSP